MKRRTIHFSAIFGTQGTRDTPQLLDHISPPLTAASGSCRSLVANGTLSGVLPDRIRHRNPLFSPPLENQG